MISKRKLQNIVYLAAILLPTSSFGGLNVLTTTSNLYTVTKLVGGDEINASLLCNPSLDAHYIEAKPSFVLKASNADLVIAIGLDLEVGWLPKIIANSRNSKLATGQKGYLEVGPLVDPLEVATAQVTRAEGDVHPNGNPHITLDPIRLGRIAMIIAKRLGELDAAHSSVFEKRADELNHHMLQKTEEWSKRILASGVNSAISYHKSFTYFFDRFKIQNPMILEPVPGVPPSAKHILDVIQNAKVQKIPLILVESYFDPEPAEKVARDVKGIRVIRAPIEVGALPEVSTLDDLFEFLTKAVTG